MCEEQLFLRHRNLTTSPPPVSSSASSCPPTPPPSSPRVTRRPKWPSFCLLNVPSQATWHPWQPPPPPLKSSALRNRVRVQISSARDPPVRPSIPRSVGGMRVPSSVFCERVAVSEVRRAIVGAGVGVGLSVSVKAVSKTVRMSLPLINLGNSALKPAAYMVTTFTTDAQFCPPL